MAPGHATARRTPGILPETGRTITVAGVTLVADVAGALYWPDQGLLAVADLHLEKGSSFAARGILLPPYDTATTLARVGELVARYAPRLVVDLGDSFHVRARAGAGAGQGPAGAVPSPTAAVSSCRRSAPTRAGSMSATAPSRRFSA